VLLAAEPFPAAELVEATPAQLVAEPFPVAELVEATPARQPAADALSVADAFPVAGLFEAPATQFAASTCSAAIALSLCAKAATDKVSAATAAAIFRDSLIIGAVVLQIFMNMFTVRAVP